MTAPDPWLGLEATGPGRWSVQLTGPLARFDAKLYGGTGLAGVVAAIEAETGRDTLWATAQYVASADVGEQIDFQVEILAGGHRTSQLRVTATVGDRVVVAALGSAGVTRPDGLRTQVGVMPAVAPPEDSPVWVPKVPFAISDENRGWLRSIDLREAPGAPEGLALWARMLDAPMTRPGLAFVGDMVPSAVVRAAGKWGGGTSLDNSMRFGPPPVTDWVLLDLDPHIAYGGYVHGAARMWSADGILLAIASQSAVTRIFG